MPWNQVMDKWKAGTLRSGAGGAVKNQKQAVAIMLSEKRKAQGSKSEYVASQLPKGAALTPQGDLGQHRGVEAKIAGAFKGSQIMSASRYFRKGPYG